MNKCENCNAKLLAKAKFCTECGTKVSINPVTNCIQCGTTYQEGDLFCTHCGANLNAGISKSVTTSKPPIKKLKPKKKRTSTPILLKSKKKRSKKGIPTFVKVLLLAGLVYGIFYLINLESNTTGHTLDYSIGPVEMENEIQGDKILEVKKAYLAAYDKYTRMVTSGEAGDIEAALSDYRKKYAAYKSLIEGNQDVESTPSDYSRSMPVRSEQHFIESTSIPSQSLSIENSAQIQIPARAALFIDSVVWKTRSPTSDEMKIGISDPVYVFENFDVHKIEGISRIRVPLDEHTPSIWFKGSAGFWFPLRYEVESIDNHDYAILQIESETAPWNMAVSEFEWVQDDVPPLLADLIQFEQRMIQDRSSFSIKEIEEIENFANTEQNKMGFFHFDQKRDAGYYWSWKMIGIYKLFRIIELTHASNAMDNWERYKKGLDHLMELKKMKLSDLDKLDIGNYLFDVDYMKGKEKLSETNNFMYYFWNKYKKASAWVEYWGSIWAPWGIEFTHAMIPLIERDNGQYISGFLACLSPVGNMPWVDIPLRYDELPPVIKSNFFEKQGAVLVDDTKKMIHTLRIYSSNAVEMNFIHSVAKYGSDYVLRWGPVLWGLVLLTGATYATAVSGGTAAPAMKPIVATLLVNLSWGAFEWYSENKVKDRYDDAQIITSVNYAHAISQREYKNFLVKIGEEAGVEMGSKSVKNTLGDARIDKGEFIVSMILAAILHYNKDGRLEVLKKMTQDRASYNGKHIPPISIVNNLSGTTRLKEDRYREIRLLKSEYAVVVADLYARQWYTKFGESELLINLNKSILSNSSIWKRYQNEFISIPHAPQRQLFRVNLSKELISQQIKTTYQKSWSHVDLEELDLFVRIKSLSGDFVKYVPLQDVTEESDIRLDQRSTVFSLNFGNIKSNEIPQYPQGFHSDKLFAGHHAPLSGRYEYDHTIPYKTENTFARRKYIIDLVSQDKNGQYIAKSETVQIDFTGVDSKKISHTEADNLLNMLSDNIPVTFEAKHNKDVTPYPIYKWNMVSTQALRPLNAEVIITGRVYRKPSNPFEETIGVANQEILISYGKQSTTVWSDALGNYEVRLKCEKERAILQTEGMQKDVDLEECPSWVPVSFELPEKETPSNDVVCTYLTDDTKEKMYEDGWDGMGYWGKDVEVTSGKNGGAFTENGEWQEPIYTENIWSNATIQFANLGVNRENFKTIVPQNTTLLSVNPKTKITKNFRSTTIAGLPTEIFEINLLLPSFIAQDTVWNNDGIERFEKHWEDSHMQRLMYFGVEGKAGANMLLIELNINAGVHNPSTLGTNMEKEHFEKLFNQATSSIHKLTFYTEPCPPDISF